MVNHKLNVDHLYICHYAKLVDRKSHINNSLALISPQGQFVEDEPQDSNLQITINKSRAAWENKTKPLNYSFPVYHRDLRESEISLSYKHIKIIHDICQSKYPSSLIFEDDVILHPNFPNLFNFCLSQTPQNWDLIFIGSGCNLRIPTSEIVSGKYAYLKKHPASKCTDSYLIRLCAAQKIVNDLHDISLPIDFEFNYLMWKYNLNVYWWEPPIVKQGSQDAALFVSQIN